ncbi:hypothetical protein ACH5RR_027919 [Cinchona calisaya]|uniref:AP2/ERF domain-containing protein n=1 Tax=Cinchona calisaya TaxID=153742 RepID=A0ABD2YSK5_9GENT
MARFFKASYSIDTFVRAQLGPSIPARRKRKMTIKKIRVQYADPDATDSSSDEESSHVKKPKHKIHEIVIIHQKNMASLESKVECIKKNIKNRFRGVRRRRYGKFVAEIRDPIKKKKIWLGTFKTAEEAYDAYLSKEREFKAAEGFHWEPVQPGLSDNDQSPSSDQPGLSDDHSPMPETGAMDSSGCTGGTGSGSSHDSASSMNSEDIVKVETMVFDGGCFMGMFIPVSGSPEDNSGSKCFLPILDNHGFFLGEFSKLDDLSLVHDGWR